MPDWLTLVTGLVGGGFVTTYLNRTFERRTVRADLIKAQRALGKARRSESDEVLEAADEVLRLGIIAGVPMWLNRLYRDVAVAEWRAKAFVPEEVRRGIIDEIGELEALSHMQFLASEAKEWVGVLNEYWLTAEWFEYAVWHPWLSLFKRRAWRKTAAKLNEHRNWLVWDAPGE